MSITTDSLRDRVAKNLPAIRCALSGGFNDLILPAVTGRAANAVPVFCYHEVGSQQLANDLWFLKENDYVALGADELLAIMARQSRMPQNAVVLTFDDGAANLYETVFPTLKAHEMRAVAFICPGLHVEDDNGTGRDQPVASSRDELCTWSQLNEMEASGFLDIQSHTLEHRNVRNWPEPVPLSGCDNNIVDKRRQPTAPDLMTDLAQARALLEKWLGKTVRHLAWPRMQHTSQAVAIAQACGYTGLWGGVAWGRSLNRPGDSPHAITRVRANWLRRLPGRRHPRRCNGVSQMVHHAMMSAERSA
jgi:peptidoglycan/xylan/chitin deacetylase (PgdA/CDA1 family)